MSDPVAHEVVVGGRQLDAAEWPGDPSSPALVLLHEGLGSVGLWRGFPAALAAATGRRVLAFSRFGHGRSERPPTPRTPAFFGTEALEVLPAVLEQLGAARPVLVGHSDGASIAIVHAAARPVAGLALLAPHVFVEAVTVAGIRETRTAFLEGGLRARMARHHDDVDAVLAGWSDVWLDPAFATWDLAADVARVRAPTLLVQGVDDAYGTLAQLDRIEAGVTGPVTRLELPGGHSPHLEQPEATVAAVAAFVAGLDR